ncbi:MAG: response regulator [Oscillospiraceae bacterium]|nr:response regulator [Oscillospiraceae bacterium]
MPKQASVYDCLISCPGDVAQYIPQLEDAARRFNDRFGAANNVMLHLTRWPTHSYPEMGAHPQTLLNRQIVDNADLLLGLFWTRFGTPTLDFESGTEEEIERSIADGKPVLLYFLDIPVNPSQIDLAQYQKVLDFQKKHREDGLYWVIPSADSLSRTVQDHLELYFNSLIHGTQYSTGGKKEILWVDDRPENNVYERKMMERYGLEFSLALSTQQALALMKTHEFALIISDMGRKEGPEAGYVLLEQVRALDKTIPFLFYAGSRKPDHIAKSIRRGAQYCTNDPAELIQLVLGLVKG